MNKKVLKVAFVAAIAIVSGINVFNTQKSDTLSDIAMAKIEALADCEISKGGSVKLRCAGKGTCSKSWMGYVLTCDGTEVK